MHRLIFIAFLAAFHFSCTGPAPSNSDQDDGDNGHGDMNTGDVAGDAAGDMTNGDSAEPTVVNGCTEDAASDHTGQDTVTITDIAAWTIGHQVCIVVDVGTTVEWAGNFTAHPLMGGETSTTDASSPITQVDATSGSTAMVTFASIGDYPYFCGIHLSSMQGVVFVR